MNRNFNKIIYGLNQIGHPCYRFSLITDSEIEKFEKENFEMLRMLWNLLPVIDQVEMLQYSSNSTQDIFNRAEFSISSFTINIVIKVFKFIYSTEIKLKDKVYPFVGNIINIKPKSFKTKNGYNVKTKVIDIGNSFESIRFNYTNKIKNVVKKFNCNADVICRPKITFKGKVQYQKDQFIVLDSKTVVIENIVMEPLVEKFRFPTMNELRIVKLKGLK